jgi:hypothetical protein
MDFLNRIFTPGRIATGLALSSEPESQAYGIASLNRQQDERVAAQEQEREAQTVATKMKMTILQKSLEAYQRPDINEEQRSKIGNDISILSQDLGVDPSALMNLPPTAQEPIKVGGSLVQKNADGSYETLFTDPSKGSKPLRPVVAKPGDEVYDNEGNLLATNKNARPTAAGSSKLGYMEGNKAEAKVKLDKAEADFNKREDLSSLASYANRFVDYRKQSGLIGVGEAKEIRGSFNKPFTALKDFDTQYNSAIEILNKDPEAITAGGSAAAGITGATANLLGVIGTILPIDPGFSDDAESWQNELNEVAGDRAQYHSIIHSLALMNAMASGLASGGLSNKDMERSILEFGGSIRSAGQARRKLREMRAKMKDALKNRLEVAVEDYSTSSEEPMQPAAQPAGQAMQQAPVSIGSDQEFDALPSGALFVGPDGVTRRKP